MSCGVRYEFSIVADPKSARLLNSDGAERPEDAPQVESNATVRDARRAEPREPAMPLPRGRQRDA